MAYPVDKETFPRRETDDIIQKEDNNAPVDFLERLQDVLGLSIRKGFDTLSLLLDYLKTECDKVINKLDKSGGVMLGKLEMNGNTLDMGLGMVEGIDECDIGRIHMQGSLTNPSMLGFQDWSFTTAYNDIKYMSGKGPLLISPNNTVYRVKVDDSGVLSTETV